MKATLTAAAGIVVFAAVAVVLTSMATTEAARGPDLTPQNFAYAFTGTNGSNTYITLTANIANIGNRKAGASTTRFTVTPVGGNQNKATGVLFPGAFETETAVYQLPAGNYTATVTADVLGAVAETNEFNNVRTLQFLI